MTSSPLSEDQLELYLLLREKDGDPTETLDAQELTLIRTLDYIVALRCKHLLKIVQKGLGIDTFELSYAGVEFDSGRFKVNANHFKKTKKGRVNLESTGFWVFPNYYLTLKTNELESQLFKDDYIEKLEYLSKERRLNEV